MIRTCLKIPFHHLSASSRHSRPRLHEGKLRRGSMFPKAFSGPPLFRLGGFAVANAGVTDSSRNYLCWGRF